jgi:hypothetical protein
MGKKIVIIGAGQLGSRHLQGVAQSSFDISIEVVEPFESSRVIAEERYNQIKNRSKVEKIEFYDSIDKLSNDIDLAIVATSSDVRSKVIRELLSKKNVDNLVLEKVLFQTIEDYASIEQLLDKTNTRCWVNHPRRMFPVYKQLKQELQSANQISYNFQGGNWGLACNSLHFIDHLSYFADSTKLTLDGRFLDNKIYDSKRKGFIEFNGLLSGKVANHTLSLYSNPAATPSIFSIVSDILIANIDEAKGILVISKKENNWEEEIRKEKIVYFQSELSSILIEDILISNKCLLPTFKEAMELHVPYIQCLLKKMDKINGKKNKLCPIT